jgi:hypothetical protein
MSLTDPDGGVAISVNGVKTAQVLIGGQAERADE